MEALNMVPMPGFELTYNGRSITADITAFMLSATYTDHLEGEADSLDIELEDMDGRWLDAWYPEKGAALAYRFGYEGQQLVSAGSFDIDEIEIGGGPSTVRMRGMAAGVQKAVRTRQGRGYDETTLPGIVKRVAKRNGMTLVGKIDPLPVDRVTQYGESDLAFLQRLARQYGYAFKVTENNKRLVFWKSADLHAQAPVRTFRPSDLQPGWRFRDKVSEVPDHVQVRHHSSKDKALVTYDVKEGQTSLVSSKGTGKTNSADTVKIARRAPTRASAEAQAKAELDRRLIERTVGDITVEGDNVLLAGVVIELLEFGKLSGKYLVQRAVHSTSRGDGYGTSLEIKRVAP